MNDDLRDLETIRRMMLQPAGHIGVCLSGNNVDEDAVVFRIGTKAESALSLCIRQAVKTMRKRAEPDTISIPVYVMRPRAIVRGLR